MDLPSGDQEGLRSCAPGDFDNTRTSPFSAGTVTISPRASKAARLPFGERAKARKAVPAFSQRGRSSLRSAATVILTSESFFDFRS